MQHRIVRLHTQVDLVAIFQGLQCPTSQILEAVATFAQEKNANEVTEICSRAAQQVLFLETSHQELTDFTPPKGLMEQPGPPQPSHQEKCTCNGNGCVLCLPFGGVVVPR